MEGREWQFCEMGGSLGRRGRGRSRGRGRGTGDSPTLSETRGRPFVAPRAAVATAAECIAPSTLVTWPKSTPILMASVFAAAPTPAASRGECLALGDSPTLSETRGRPFVAPRAAVATAADCSARQEGKGVAVLRNGGQLG